MGLGAIRCAGGGGRLPTLEAGACGIASLGAPVAIEEQADGQRAAREQHVEDVVGGVYRDDAEHVMPVDQADDRNDAVDSSEEERAGPRSPMPAGHEQEEDAGEDVDDVVPTVDLEDEEVLAVNASRVAAGRRVELRVGEKAEDTNQQESGPDDQAIPLGD